MTNENEKETSMLSWWAVTIISIAIVALIMLFNCNAATEQATTTATALCQRSYSLEGKILLNQLQETKEFYSKTWDLNEWLAVRNSHLEQHYNLLLEYDDDTLTRLLYSQEMCLDELLDAKLSGDVNLQDAVGQRCNDFGEAIEARHLEVLEGKMGEN